MCTFPIHSLRTRLSYFLLQYSILNLLLFKRIGHLPSTSLACKAATAVAQLWELRPESAEALITTRRPKLEHTNRLEKSLVVIGRITLRVFSVAKAKYSSFALTSASQRVMERIAAW